MVILHSYYIIGFSHCHSTSVVLTNSPLIHVRKIHSKRYHSGHLVMPPMGQCLHFRALSSWNTAPYRPLSSGFLTLFALSVHVVCIRQIQTPSTHAKITATAHRHVEDRFFSLLAHVIVFLHRTAKCHSHDGVIIH